MKKFSIFCITVLFTAILANAQDTTGREMTGKYKFPAGSVIEEAVVTWENGVLTMSSTAGVSVLEKMKGDTFNVVSFSGICVFKRNETKKVTGVHVDASGYILDGEKEATAAPHSIVSMMEDMEKQNAIIREFIQWHRANPRSLRIYN